jgi:hypothetical protein
LSKTKPFWTTSKFKKLAKKWDIKLKDSGFKDAEHSVNGFRNLVTSSNPYRNSILEDKESKEAYYRLMGQHVYNSNEFDNNVDKLVMMRYVSGVMIKDICKELKQKGSPRHRQTIRYIIRKYESKWKVRKWPSTR